jgi:hypothetical protein
MTHSQTIEQAIRTYLQQVDSGEDPSRLVTLFTGGPTSALAESLIAHSAQFEHHGIEVQAVFAGGDAEALGRFAEKVGIGRRGGAGSIRYIKARQYGSYNEQLVLGSSSFISGLTIGEVNRDAELSAIDVSDAKSEVAVATFAFNQLWKAAATDSSNMINKVSMAIAAGSLGGLSAKLLQLASRPFARQQVTTT